MLKLDNPQMMLDWARELGKAHAFLDLHVHPYEVLSGDIGFKPDPQTEGLFTKGLFNYHAPALDNEIETLPSSNQSVPDNYRSLFLSAQLTYKHTGRKVFADQINLAGLSGALLLPVARTVGKAEEMLEVSYRMFQMDDRLFLGCALPIGIQADKLDAFFRSARRLYGIRAIKFHPNLAGIDPLTKEGRDLIYASLTVAGELGLPIIIHGGRSPGLEPAEMREYGTISRLAMMNWSISTSPVILAHAGCYGLTHAESIDALFILDNLLEKHSNLMADISNLEPPILRLVLEKIPSERLVFGSDALYIPIWKAWVRFLQTLQLVSAFPDDDLIRIASLNPAGCLSLSVTR
jgi:predicted TIM-barrel fold metal-dependent hydrolase